MLALEWILIKLSGQEGLGISTIYALDQIQQILTGFQSAQGFRGYPGLGEYNVPQCNNRTEKQLTDKLTPDVSYFGAHKHVV